MAGETDLRLDEVEDSPGIPHQVPCTTLDNLRGLVRSYQARQQHQSALYWADKLVILSCGDPSDVYLVVMALLSTKELPAAEEQWSTHQAPWVLPGCCSGSPSGGGPGGGHPQAGGTKHKHLEQSSSLTHIV